MLISTEHALVYPNRLDADLSMYAANLDLMNTSYHYVHLNSFLQVFLEIFFEEK